MVKDLIVGVSRGDLQVRQAIEIIDFVPKESRAPRSAVFNVTVTLPETDIAIDKCILEAADENGTVQSLTVDALYIAQSRIVCVDISYPYSTITLGAHHATSGLPWKVSEPLSFTYGSVIELHSISSNQVARFHPH